MSICDAMHDDVMLLRVVQCFCFCHFAAFYCCRQYQHELWLRRETLAQVEFRKKKQAEERVAKAREEREVCG